MLKPFSEQAKQLKIGLYRHYKGNEYLVLHVARHSETLEEYVVYRALYGERDVWCRPIEMFCENVVIEGKEQPRFMFIQEEK